DAFASRHSTYSTTSVAWIPKAAPFADECGSVAGSHIIMGSRMRLSHINLVIASALLLAACTQQPSTSSKTESTAPPAAAVEAIPAVLIGSDKRWGKTEGAAMDSKSNFYFCSRGTYKGIVMFNEKDGAKPWLVVATKE